MENFQEIINDEFFKSNYDRINYLNSIRPFTQTIATGFL